ncbi:hypothetical protein JB92DRAFT_3093130 [Gautieria morchelliformis]|nr:hypothetical protein JB92DRAFT_3093130 [Gautieria morchelliformis]
MQESNPFPPDPYGKPPPTLKSAALCRDWCRLTADAHEAFWKEHLAGKESETEPESDSSLTSPSKLLQTKIAHAAPVGEDTVRPKPIPSKPTSVSVGSTSTKTAKKTANNAITSGKIAILALFTLKHRQLVLPSNQCIKGSGSARPRQSWSRALTGQAEPGRPKKPGSGFDKPGPSREAAALEHLDGMGEAALGGSTAPRHSVPAPRMGNLDKALKVQMRDEKGVFSPCSHALENLTLKEPASRHERGVTESRLLQQVMRPVHDSRKLGATAMLWT